jgi:hypothetical protein
MYRICARLLGLQILLISLFTSGCGFAAKPSHELAPNRQFSNRIVVDLSARTAVASTWRSSVVDCSDQDYQCISIPDRMVLAFPRRCSSVDQENSPPTRFGRLHRVAPMPHLRPPSGSFIISSFPNILFFYFTNEGIVEARILNHGPFEGNAFDPNDYSERYEIIRSDHRPLFVCED